MEYSISKYSAKLLEFTEKSFSTNSLRLIKEALDTAVGALSGMTRYDGDPFVVHSIKTALIVAEEIGLGRNSVVSTLLHDVVRLKLISLDEVGKRFSNECVTILSGLCNISNVDTKTSESQIDNFKDLILSYSTDPRVILIKLADRLEVMRSLESFPSEKRHKKSWETLHLYAEIAHRLGLYRIKSEMEDLYLKYTYPDDYNHIVDKLAESQAQRTDFINLFTAPIEQKLRQSGIKYVIKSRTKSIYSIWRKMKTTGVAFEEVYDVFAVRIIIDCPPEQEKTLCWSVYSIVTDFYTPNPDRLRDWISIHKSNGYESLHTTVVTPEGKWVEVQIRSERMDAIAERGVAAHWRYKGVVQGGITSEQWLQKLREIMEATESVSGLPEKMSAPISSKEIFVFTPNGDLRKLRDGATVLDFAYEIHTSLGNRCTGARINLRNVSLKEKLRNGDVVEILTSKNQKPKPDWLNIAVTSKARQRIKVFLREEQAKESVTVRETLERKIKNWKLTATVEEAATTLCKHFKLKTATELYMLIAEGRITTAEIKEILTGTTSAENEGSKPRTVAKPKSQAEDEDSIYIEDSLKNVSYKLAKCCNPIYGDEVFGFVTISAGITIHRTDCSNGIRLMNKYPYRVLRAKWRNEAAAAKFRATIRIQAEDTGGLVNKITEVITKDLKINIRSMNLNSSAGTLSGLVNIEVPGTKVVDMVIHNLLRIKGVQKVFRINTA